MFWWESRNEYIESKKEKELKRKLEEQKTRAAMEHKQQTERRKKGLLFVRQVQKQK